MHRFEVYAAVLVLLVVGAGAVFYAARLDGIGVPVSCTSSRLPECDVFVDRFWGIESGSQWLRGAVAGVFPIIVGLLLGAPVVARELESGTAQLSWSLTSRRSLWLLHRMLPLFALALAGLVVVGALETWLHASSNWRHANPSIDWVGAQGPSFVARGLGTFGVALLLGAIVGRTLPTFILAGGVAVIVVAVVTPAFRDIAAEHLSEWRDLPYSARAGDFVGERPVLLQLESWFRSPDDGRLVTEEEFYQLYPASDDFEAFMQANAVRADRVVQLSRFGSFEWAEAGAWLVIGACAVALTFPTVGRRRPG